MSSRCTHDFTYTMVGCTFAMQQVTNIILSIIGISSKFSWKNSIGNFACHILNRCLRVPMALTTWILKFESFRLSSTDFGAIWASYFSLKCGINIWARFSRINSCTVKPLSAKTTSPGIRLSKIPQRSVMYLSEARPPYPLEIKVMAPCGLTPIKNLTVVLF